MPENRQKGTKQARVRLNQFTIYDKLFLFAKTHLTKKRILNFEK